MGCSNSKNPVEAIGVDYPQQSPKESTKKKAKNCITADNFSETDSTNRISLNKNQNHNENKSKNQKSKSNSNSEGNDMKKEEITKNESKTDKKANKSKVRFIHSIPEKEKSEGEISVYEYASGYGTDCDSYTEYYDSSY